MHLRQKIMLRFKNCSLGSHTPGPFPQNPWITTVKGTFYDYTKCVVLCFIWLLSKVVTLGNVFFSKQKLFRPSLKNGLFAVTWPTHYLCEIRSYKNRPESENVFQLPAQMLRGFNIWQTLYITCYLTCISLLTITIKKFIGIKVCIESLLETKTKSKFMQVKIWFT